LSVVTVNPITALFESRLSNSAVIGYHYMLLM
jgi:hypothetical protein